MTKRQEPQTIQTLHYQNYDEVSVSFSLQTQYLIILLIHTSLYRTKNISIKGMEAENIRPDWSNLKTNDSG